MVKHLPDDGSEAAAAADGLFQLERVSSVKALGPSSMNTEIVVKLYVTGILEG